MWLPTEQFEMIKAAERLLRCGIIDLITFQRVKYEAVTIAKKLEQAERVAHFAELDRKFEEEFPAMVSKATV